MSKTPQQRPIKIPHYIKIGGDTWKIIHSPHLHDDECRGKVYKEKREIHLSIHISDAARQTTFMHEALHAIFESRGTSEEEQFDEEAAVTAIAPLLTQVIQQLKHD